MIRTVDSTEGLSLLCNMHPFQGRTDTWTVEDLLLSFGIRYEAVLQIQLLGSEAGNWKRIRVETTDDSSG